MDYAISRAAEADLIALYREGADRFGPTQADRYHASLQTAFEFLARHPQAARERSEISPPIRCHPHGSHLILYRADTAGQVLILRVRHAREDWESEDG